MRCVRLLAAPAIGIPCLGGLRLTLCRCLNYDHLVADLEKLISAKNCGPIMSGAQPGSVFPGMMLVSSTALAFAAMNLSSCTGCAQSVLIFVVYVQLLLCAGTGADGCPNAAMRLAGLTDEAVDENPYVDDAQNVRGTDGDKDANHIRGIFGPKGFEDRDMVALSGAHTDKLLFDNSYFKDLLQKPWTKDMALVEDPAFKQHVERYAADQKSWFDDFAKACVQHVVKITQGGVDAAPSVPDSPMGNTQPQPFEDIRAWKMSCCQSSDTSPDAAAEAMPAMDVPTVSGGNTAQDSITEVNGIKGNVALMLEKCKADQTLEQLQKDVKKSASTDRSKWLEDLASSGEWKSIKALRRGRITNQGRVRTTDGELVSSDLRQRHRLSTWNKHNGEFDQRH
ncbi:putative L-ascorbate peroxidase 3 [Symbiodinium microadriaticum]|uniref:Putative L-ascorbate peroxidase 3 n=1 Tax=Symbiodinium microadriaticum TaxID=2951 RepID=A0A1Q9D6E2_SYMMI|nr:putative L-ascorbate peroxidase 3 [Symbiodinium microadriaticum]